MQNALMLVRARYANPADIDKPLRDLARFLRAEYPSQEFNAACLALTTSQALEYMEWQREQPGTKPQNGSRAPPTRSGKTMRNYYFGCSQLFDELVYAGTIERNPFARIRPPRAGEQKLRTRYIEPDQVAAMLACASVRDLAILSCIFGGGMRRSEVSNLDIGDVLASARGLVLHLRRTKNGKQRKQLLPAWAGEAVNEYFLQRRKETGNAPDAPLFIGRHGRRLGDDGICKMFQRVAREAGIEGWIAPHSGRATAITKLLKDGVPHRLVMIFSGHSSVQQVETYDRDTRELEDHPGADLAYVDNTRKHGT